ncbi:MAG: hypothetical protein UU88_C0003G0051 [Parcubacteria group bacterium GW2011_GWC1_42_11]|uniref:Polysaccharide biosynthesis protein n=1 Tax=Candidatus Nomurabacteria bacterium GW2011_GWC2_42_20 TaxID=1618756 RepID=A0A0G1BQ69_9BACT|nr:MAG: hypothetical protein UU88_C0003G0051 [Parcubacteria group bacterium GW2011_GWC1_42_11]KKS48386.1 MAG: hypothetical protein UV12_C0001G0081 [Candidatus Nomurabacteria bacterium GW2011_GWC2_42_20]KKT09962.1 MAG: hypothetical protein UV86_C0001G0064 [Candidatus Nomurabacteria bacterium GW2011_GWB1_43_20]
MWMTKNMAIIGSIGFVATYLLLQRPFGYFLYKYCQNFSWGETCMSIINYSALLLLFLAVMFVPSVISLLFKSEVFELWKRTLFIYLS